jgi:carbonic anhydrase/acetyltransferase-like protein (isoleucine patch superfamily)
MEPIELATPSIDPSAFCAPGVHVYGDVTIGPDAVILFGTVIRAELDRIVIGARTNIQDNSVVHCDEGVPCRIGSHTTVGHAAVVHGATVGDHCLIGIGARVLNGATVGDGAWVAAGGLVTEGTEIPPWTLALGVPAKPVRELTEDEILRQRNGVAEYLRFAATYTAVFES